MRTGLNENYDLLKRIRTVKISFSLFTMTGVATHGSLLSCTLTQVCERSASLFG